MKAKAQCILFVAKTGWRRYACCGESARPDGAASAWLKK